jgi:hypothetical protein
MDMAAGRCSSNGNGYPLSDIEIQSQSLDKHHRRHSVYPSYFDYTVYLADNEWNDN